MRHDFLSSVSWFSSVRAGLADARALWRIVLVVWATLLLLAWMASLPAWRWWDRMLPSHPEGDRLLEGLNLPLIHELFQYDRSPTTAIALGSSFTFFLIALAINPFLSGGVLGLLHVNGNSNGQRIVAGYGMTRRFVQDGARFYWRLARVLLVVGTVGTMASLFVMLALAGGAEELDLRGYERAGLWVGDAAILAALLMFGLTSLVVDLARVHVVRADEPRAVMGIAGGLRFLAQHTGAVLGVGIAFLVCFVVAVAIYVLVSSSVTPRAWPLIFFIIVFQQIFSVVRTALRVSLLGALTSLVEWRSPAIALEPLPVTSTASPQPVSSSTPPPSDSEPPM